MSDYRKIKIFKFSDFESYDLCQDAANDYYAELAKRGYDCDIVMNVDYISVNLPKISGLFRSRQIPNTKIEDRAEIFKF